MKKLTITFFLMIFSSSILFSQSDTDIDPNAVINPHASTFTDGLFDHQFSFYVSDGYGEGGVETNGEYIYTSKWNGDGFFCYEMDGNFLGWFPVTGEAGVRDLAYDGSYFYGAAANTELFEMDFQGPSGTLISTLTAGVETRACAYDFDYDGFWGSNWSNPITLYDRTGEIIKQFNCCAHSSYYGFACLDDAGTPRLYGFAQSGGASQAVIVQIDPETGDETGVTFDAIGYSTTGTGVAGGLAAYDTYSPGCWTILGIIQNQTVFGVEGGIAFPSPELDLALKNIIEPNTGFGLGVEHIVIRVKNQGSITQTDFDVQYRINGGAWITETIAGPIAMNEFINYTFNQAYDFSDFGEYLIEAEVILTGDENPDNNYYDKTIENTNPSALCTYSITMWDDDGDGWNGGYVQIFGDGVEYLNATLNYGSGPETIEFFVHHDSFLTAVWTAGGDPYDCEYVIYDIQGNLVFEDGIGYYEPTGGDIGYASCVIYELDAGVSKIILPGSYVYSDIVPVRIKVKNFGSQLLLGIPVGFNLDGTGWINEIITGPIYPGYEVEYTFADSVDLSELNTYILETCSFIPDDGYPYNDCKDKEIEHSQCYYMDGHTSAEDEYIANVLMGMIDNSSGWQGGTADYTDLFTNIYNGIPQEIVVTNGNPWPDDYVFVWIDWNEDCIFEVGSGGEQYQLDNIYGTGQVFKGDIMAPEDVIEGSYRMRVRMVYQNSSPCPTCDYTYGEIEDYTCVFFENFIPPEITWNPTSFTQFIEYGGIAQDFLSIGNMGGSTLIWNIEVTVPWLDIDPIRGYIEPNDSIEIALNFNTEYLLAGNYFADLILTSNDSLYPEVIIPVVMIVGSYITTQTFDLEAGFKFVSSNIIPDDPDMTVVLSDILNDNLDFVRNSEGQTLRKIGSNWVNGIGDWIVEEGYLVKMFNEDSFSIEGVLLDPKTPIPVDLGFQFVSYFSLNPMDALIAFETIIGDNLDYIRNSNGQMLRKIGPVWINGIGDCQSGEGYLVKMHADDVLIYPGCGDPFTDPRDGQTYNTVKIGNQCWMAENLNIGEMIHGSVDMTNNGVIEKYCYDNDPANCETYGGLYLWNEMMQYVIDTAVQGICPAYWHLPTDFEWKILEGTVDSQYFISDPIWNESGWRGYDAGFNLKSVRGWYEGGNGSGLYGYEALPGGHRTSGGNFSHLTNIAYFWMSNEHQSNFSWSRYLYWNKDEVQRSLHQNYVGLGNSVRCLRDNSIFYPAGRSMFDDLSERRRNKNTFPDHFILEGGNPADPVYTIYVDGLEIGDEIAAYNGDVLVGAMKINSINKFENELPVFSVLNNGKGYTPGNPIILKVWDKSENKEYILNDYTFSNPYGDAWTENVFPSEDGEYSLLHFSPTGISDENVINEISIYPNPSEGIFYISIEGVSGKVQIKVFDVHGNDYRFLEIEGTQKITRKKLDLKELAAGVYFINFSGEDFNQVKKIVIQ